MTRLVNLHIILFLSLVLISISSCNVTKHLPEDEWLYNGAELKVTSTSPIKGKAELKYELEDVIEPKPNSTPLGIRFGLYWHIKAQKENAGKTAKFLDKKFGEKPVYLSDVNPIWNETILNNRCENQGYFYPKIQSKIVKKGRKAIVQYEVEVSKPYTLASYRFKGDSTHFDSLLHYSLNNTILTPKTRFSTDYFKQERNRIDDFLKDNGYYLFNPDVLIFTSDTNQYDDRQFDLVLSFKTEATKEALKPYRIRNVEATIMKRQGIDDSSALQSVVIDSIPIYQPGIIFKPNLLRPYITLHPGMLYNKSTTLNTSKRLAATKTFNIINLKYSQVDTTMADSIGLLDASIVLSPAQKQTIRIEGQGTVKSNSFAGPGLIGSYFNKNLFKGGERLEISGNLSYEVQFGGGATDPLTALEFKILNSITFPRFLTPFNFNPISGNTIPNTKISFDYILQKREQYYVLNSYILSFGYNWKSRPTIYQEIAPISLNFTNVQQVTPEFQEILDENPFLAASFQNQFIPGLTYLLQYSEPWDNDSRGKFYFAFSADIAGNLIGAIHDITGNDHTLFNLPYAQYLRGDIDVRHYTKVARKSSIVSRLFVGVGYPYNMSTSLPFSKQYYSGGPNSVRGFRVRTIGPGSYQLPDSITSSSSFFDRTGDIRLEANLEFRHPIVSLLHGAVFVDAGNIWLYNDNPALPGGKFSSSWSQEIAISAGYGVRLDIDFVVIRVDIGTPIRFPYKKGNSHWQDEFKISYKSWRQDNIIWNFSIGYPF